MPAGRIDKNDTMTRIDELDVTISDAKEVIMKGFGKKLWDSADASNLKENTCSFKANW